MQPSKWYIIRLKWTHISQVITFGKYLARPMQPTYVNPTYLEKNTSLTLAHTTPHHLDDIQIDQPCWKYERYFNYPIVGAYKHYHFPCHSKWTVFLLIQLCANTRKMTMMQMNHHQITFLKYFLVLVLICVSLKLSIGSLQVVSLKGYT